MNRTLLIYGLIWRLFVVFSVPLGAVQRAFAGQSQGPVTNIATHYSNELILFGSVVCLVLGSLLGTFYPVPAELKQAPTSLKLKLLISVCGGVAAFIYIVNVDKALTPLNPLWVGGVAFVSPAIIQTVQSVLIRWFSGLLKQGD